MRVFLYCRSSKDRAGASTHAQETTLRAHAKANGWTVVGIASDSEISGVETPTARPGLQSVLNAVEAKACDVVLCLDPSRWSRDMGLSVALEKRLERFGVRLAFHSLPEGGDDATRGLIRNVMRSIDQWTSEISAYKSKASQTHLIRQGLRGGGGGKPPIGYKAEHTDSGIVRAGKPVMRSRWVLSEHAPIVREYLLLRADGVARTAALRRSGLGELIQTPSSVAVDRRAALGIYSGTAVWNVRRKLRPTLEQPGRRMVPRAESEHVVVPDSHPAIIDEATAQRLKARLEGSLRFNVKKQRAGSPARLKTILGDVLWDEHGKLYQVDCGGKFYRASSGRRFTVGRVDRKVFHLIAKEAKRGDLPDRLLAKHQREREEGRDRLPRLERDLAAVDKRRARLIKAIESSGTDLSTLTDRLRAVEIERAELLAQVESARAMAGLQERVKKIDASGWFDFALYASPEDGVDAAPLEETRDRLRAVVARIALDSETGKVSVTYRMPEVLVRMALPEGFEPSYQP